jgi:hypothetical protein
MTTDTTKKGLEAHIAQYLVEEKSHQANAPKSETK